MFRCTIRGLQPCWTHARPLATSTAIFGIKGQSSIFCWASTECNQSKRFPFDIYLNTRSLSFESMQNPSSGNVLTELLRVFPNLALTTDLSCTTVLQTAATQGHIDVVNLLLQTDVNLLKIARNNGKTVLHSAARMGHLEVARSLLRKDRNSGFRTDKEGQTALHMAVKGQNEEIVLELLEPDPSVMHVEDNKGNAALHIAIKKGRAQNVHRLLSVEGVNINAINKAGDTPLDVAEKLGLQELVSILKESGANNSEDSGKPPSSAKKVKQTVSDVKREVLSELKQSRQTGFRVQKIAKKLTRLHISSLNNAISNSIIVAVLIATVAFAAIFTAPSQYVDEKTDGAAIGQAHIARNPAFLVFFVFDSLALFISLAVVVVQTSVVLIEETAKKSRWLAIYATVIGGIIMLATIGSMCYFVSLNRVEQSKFRNIKRQNRSRSNSSLGHQIKRF